MREIAIFMNISIIVFGIWAYFEGTDNLGRQLPENPYTLGVFFVLMFIAPIINLIAIAMSDPKKKKDKLMLI